MKAEVDYLLKEGINSQFESPYGASAVLLKKPSGEHRLCIDYRQLNGITKFHLETLPDQGQFLSKLSKAKYFSKVDLSKGYYQKHVKKEVRPYLAFSTSEGHYEFNMLPFGLSNAPGVFTRKMRMLLNPLNDGAISNFMDDILIVTVTFEEHLTSLSNLLTQLAYVGLPGHPTKCQLAFTSLGFLCPPVAQSQDLVLAGLRVLS